MPSSVAPDSFPIFRLGARGVKDPRLTELLTRADAADLRGVSHTGRADSEPYRVGSTMPCFHWIP